MPETVQSHDHAKDHVHDHPEDEKKIEPKVDVKEVGPCKLSVRVEVAAAKIKEIIDHKYHDLNEKMAIPGFRPGKTPRTILERKFGKSVLDEVKFEVLSKSYEEAREAKKLEPLGEPDFDPEKIEVKEGSDLAYEFTLEVKPSFELKPYTGLPVKKAAVTVAAKEIDEELENLRESHAELVPVEEGAKEKDTVVADFELTVKGKSIDTSENNSITLVPDISFYGKELPEFYKAILGKKPGSAVEVPLTLPTEFHDKSVAGQPAVIKAKIKSIKRRKLPELDAAFAKTFDLDSIDELRDDIKKHLTKAKEGEAKGKMADDLVELLVKQNAFPLPEGYLKDRAAAVEERMKAELESEGAAEKDAKKAMTKELAGSKDRVEKALREELILDQIATKEKIFVTEDQVEERLFKIATQMGQDLHTLRTHFEERGILGQMRRTMRHEAVRDFLVSKAKTE